MIWVGITISVFAFCLWATLSTIAAQLKRIADAQERMASMYPVSQAEERRSSMDRLFQVEDLRDRRDPTKLGEALMFPLLRREAAQHAGLAHTTPVALSQVYDYGAKRQLLSAPHVPNYDPAETLLQSSVARRQQELRDRAAQGDKYAISMLNGEAYTEPSDGLK